MTQTLIVHTNLKNSDKKYFLNGKRISRHTAIQIMDKNDSSVVVSYRT